MTERDEISALLNRINHESVDKYPLMTTWDAADHILNSKWLADHDQKVRAELQQRIPAEVLEAESRYNDGGIRTWAATNSAMGFIEGARWAREQALTEAREAVESLPESVKLGYEVIPRALAAIDNLKDVNRDPRNG